MVRYMKSRLENLFYIPTLSNNLRNSSEVFTMTEVITANEIFSNIKDSLGVTTVAMTIHATTPKLIPIIEKEITSNESAIAESKINDQILGDAIMFAIQKTRQETNEPNSSFVILHDLTIATEALFNVVQSKKSSDDELFKYPPNPIDQSPNIEYLNDLMENKTKGFLVLKDSGFKGSEAMNIILILDGNGRSVSDMRCNLLRCVSNLTIIQRITSQEVLKFDKVRQFDNFLKCTHECRRIIYECQTCVSEQKNDCGEQNRNNVFLCLSCKMRKSCHPIDHRFVELNVEKHLNRKQVKCGCHCNTFSDLDLD